MTAFGRPPLWIVLFYSLGGFNSQAPPVSVCSQKCGSYVIDSAKGDGGGAVAEVAKMERTGGERESLFYMLQPLHYAVEETALFPLLDDTERESRTGGRQLIAFVVAKKIDFCMCQLL